MAKREEKTTVHWYQIRRPLGKWARLDVVHGSEIEAHPKFDRLLQVGAIEVVKEIKDGVVITFEGLKVRRYKRGRTYTGPSNVELLREAASA